jgi:hypothetical protein
MGKESAKGPEDRGLSSGRGAVSGREDDTEGHRIKLIRADSDPTTADDDVEGHRHAGGSRG